MLLLLLGAATKLKHHWLVHEPFVSVRLLYCPEISSDLGVRPVDR
jgi:hypothetical protein